MIDKTFCSNCFMIHVFIVNEVSTNSNVYCKNYWKELLKQCTMCKNCNYFYAYFHNQLKLFLLPFLRHLQFQYILQLISQLIFSKLTIFIVQILTNITWYITYTFIINPLSHIPLSINYLHSHCHLSLFHLCLLLQTLSSSVHICFYMFLATLCVLFY